MPSTIDPDREAAIEERLCCTAQIGAEPAAWYGRFLRFCQLGGGRSILAAVNAERWEHGQLPPVATIPPS